MYNWLNMRAGCRIHSNGIMHAFVEQFVMVTDGFWEVGDESATSLFPPFSKQQNCTTSMKPCNLQPVQEVVSYRGLFTAGWFGVREKHCSWLEIYDRLRASEQAVYRFAGGFTAHTRF